MSVVAEIDRYVGDSKHCAGVFASNTLAKIEELLPRDVERTCETGCGKTTILFSNISGDHTVFALDDSNKQESSVNYYRNCPLTRVEKIREVFGPSQLTLPHYDHPGMYDIVLIDGPHGFPFPELEYYYFYPLLKAQGFLLIDDVNVPTIGRLADIIAEDEMFELVSVVDITAVFRRTESETFDPLGDGWWTQRYNRRRVSPRRPIFLPADNITETITSMALDRKVRGG